MENQDTILFTRSRDSWWYGIISSVNLGFSIGDLKIPQNVSIPVQKGNEILTYKSSFISGFGIGLHTKYLPVEEYFGGSLRLFLWDSKSSNSYVGPLKDSMKTTYYNNSTYNYLSVSPSLIYNLPVDGLHLYAGLDADILLSENSRLQPKFENTGFITQSHIIPVSPEKIRYGGHLGIGWDFLVADVNNNSRVFFTPYLTIHAGSTAFKGYGSNRNGIIFRVGLSAQISFDDVKADTLPYNPNYVSPVNVVARVGNEKGIVFEGFTGPIAAVDVPLIYIASVGAEERAETAPSLEIEKPTAPPRKVQNVRPGESKKFYYPTSPATGINKQINEYLDYVVEFLKANPKATVRIVGHSDNQGTLEQNQQRSEERANQIVRYLLNKDISKSRIYSRGDGALYPIGDNRTEEGRAKNRRVEIVVIQ